MSDFPIAAYLRDNCDVEFEYVELGGTRKAGDPPRWFICDQRMYEHQTEPWVCIHDWTASPASLLRNLQWTSRFPKPWDKVFVIEARNKGQVVAWLEQYGYNPQYGGKRLDTPPHTQERYIVDARARKLAQEEAIIARAQARIDRLASLPDEPTTDDPDGALVVWFTHQFNERSKRYTYAAVKAGDGLWYTTGPASPKGYTWDQLIDWHLNEINADATMWVATEWEPVL